MFHSFFESGIFRTLKAYTVFLTLLNVPHLVGSLVGKAKLSLEAVFQGSDLMFSVQVRFWEWLIDRIGSLFGQKRVFDSLEKWLAGLTSAEASSAILMVMGVVLTLLLLHLSIRLFGRFIPALADLHTHHRTTPWSLLYLILFALYIVISITT